MQHRKNNPADNLHALPNFNDCLLKNNIRMLLLGTLFLFSMVPWLGCNTRQGSHNNTAARSGSTTVLSSDGVSIRFHVQGTGIPEFVFIHGWSCDSTYWKEQIAYFASRYRVVTLDLAGHGGSGHDRRHWTIAQFGRDVAAVIKKLELEQVILVGHSMGGAVMLEAFRIMPKRIIGLVGVDTLRDVDEKFTPEQIDKFMQPFKKDFSNTTSTFVRSNMFVASSDAVLVEKIAADMSAAPQEIANASTLAMLDYNNKKLHNALQNVRVPLYCINSSSKATNMKSLKNYIPSFKETLMPHVGHFVMLEDPETFNNHLSNTVEKIVGRSAVH